jgi:hypothetical protein
MRQLSKSKIIAFRQCPKRLWLELHRPELRDYSGSEMVFVIGHQVGDVARQIYDTAGNGRLIDVNEIGWDAAFADTSAWLATTPAPLFEAAIRIEGALTGTNSQVTPRFGRRRHQISPRVQPPLPPRQFAKKTSNHPWSALNLKKKKEAP